MSRPKWDTSILSAEEKAVLDSYITNRVLSEMYYVLAMINSDADSSLTNKRDLSHLICGYMRKRYPKDWDPEHIVSTV